MWGIDKCGATNVLRNLTPFLPQHVKYPGWKVHTHMPVKSIFDGSNFNTAHTYANLSTCSCEGEKKRKRLNDFKFGTCIGRFPSDVAARMAMKGLMFQPLKQRQSPRKQLLRTSQQQDKTSRHIRKSSSTFCSHSFRFWSTRYFLLFLKLSSAEHSGSHSVYASVHWQN